MAEIEFEKVTKSFGEGALAVDQLDLGIKDGEFMVLVGPSGCGKSTALRMVAGLEAISDGEIKIGGRVVNEVPPKDRDIAMVFQNYALYPHMTVYDNMAFALKLAKVDKGEMDKRVKEAAHVLGLDEFLGRKPRALSGGQRQRVAMGRAIVREPQAFLMDEPLSNLDAKLRVQMRSEIGRIQDDLEVTTIYVTHDQVEAMTMGDRVAVMRKGELQQVGTPTELFLTPVNLFTAGFIGSPSMNFLSSKLERSNGNYQIDVGGQKVTIHEKVTKDRPELEKYDGKEIIIGVRPQDFEDKSIMGDDAPEGSSVKAKVDLVEVLGTETLVHFELNAPMVMTEDMKELQADAGGQDPATVESRAEEGTNEFVAQLDPKSRIKRGEEVELFIDTRQLHFFDIDNSQGIYGGDGDRAAGNGNR
ncbi:MAG: sn-glycerol-3-phosphate ABC transporter ATP-binding protein UgpC [Actinobacteria bacterium]|jgi:multiple sugar transport system ATP-binding protein|nr:sn-glycerol-3-phosphate ABC transporter ATP-binding protein UgpC [Actinomycetota bacterium]